MDRIRSESHRNSKMATFAEAPPGNPKAGEKIFKTKCAQCHTVDKGAGHKQGLSLSLWSTSFSKFVVRLIYIYIFMSVLFTISWEFDIISNFTVPQMLDFCGFALFVCWERKDFFFFFWVCVCVWIIKFWVND